MTLFNEGVLFDESKEDKFVITKSVRDALQSKAYTVFTAIPSAFNQLSRLTHLIRLGILLF